MELVVLGLIGVWLLCSWLVYQAEYQAQGANITSYVEGLWWGIVTFLTVGYGDRYPITLEGRIVGGVLMLAGITAVGIVTAKISSYFLEQMLRKGRGFVDSNRLNDHFVVCGWREDMQQLLLHVLDFNPGLTSEHLVLVANVNPNVVDTLRDEIKLKKLQIIIGDYFQEAYLKKAAPDRARKILILADQTLSQGGQASSQTEVDARTIMTAMTLSHIARGTLVAAEILDPKMDQYLKLASVSEIIYSGEYSRLLLGTASGGTGITNILFDLLDPKTASFINTRPISDHHVHQLFGEFKTEFESKHSSCVVIGILENTGNQHRIKELALRQAQKTPDVRRLVENLKAVKEIRCNSPILNPSNQYVIPEGSMAIVIESRSLAKEDVHAGLAA